MLDTTARSQIRETRTSLLDHLRTAPGDVKALFLASVVAELDPDRDPVLLGHAARANAQRAADPDGFAARARELGLDVLLCNLALGFAREKIGAAAIPILARRCAEVSANALALSAVRDLVAEREDAAAGRALAAIDAAIAARVPRLADGVIDASFVPSALARSRHATVRYHPNGHLAEVVVKNGRQRGHLRLASNPGHGDYQLEGKTGGYGHLTVETHRGGTVHTTLYTPWHDGSESESSCAWTSWVAECLQSLAEAALRQKL